MTRPILLVIPPEPGSKAKRSSLAVVTHRGGGWWQASCMGQTQRCAAGECDHIADLRMASGRRVRPVARGVR
jgi:hypothetical protein